MPEFLEPDFEVFLEEAVLLVVGRLLAESDLVALPDLLPEAVTFLTVERFLLESDWVAALPVLLLDAAGFFLAVVDPLAKVLRVAPFLAESDLLLIEGSFLAVVDFLLFEIPIAERAFIARVLLPAFFVGAVIFLAAVFLAVVFLAKVLRVAAFLAVAFLANVPVVERCLTAAVFLVPVDFLLVVFLAGFNKAAKKGCSLAEMISLLADLRLDELFLPELSKDANK